MKILEVSFANPNDPNAAGLESYIRDLSYFLRSKDMQIDIVFADTNKFCNLSNDNLIGLKIPKVVSMLKLTKIYYNVALIFFLKNQMGIYNVIHINGDNGIFIPFFKGFKTIITLHGSMTEIAEFQREHQKPFRLHSYLMSRFLGIMEESASRRVNKVIAVSNHVKEYFELKTKRVDINVVNTCVFTNKIRELNTAMNSMLLQNKNDGKTICLWVGKDPIRKGLKIAKQIVKDKKNIILYTVGYSDLEKDPNVVNLGIIDEKSLNTLYIMSDIFIFPSKYEGFSVAVIESMSNGLIPITFAIPSAAEIITDGKNGFICKDENEMNIKLDFLMENKDKMSSMKIHAYERSLEFDCNILYDKIYKIINEM